MNVKNKKGVYVSSQGETIFVLCNRRKQFLK